MVRGLKFKPYILIFSIELFMFNSLFSQDYLKLFKNEVPLKVIGNKTVEKEIQNEITILSNLNPLLISTYFDYLNLRYNSGEIADSVFIKNYNQYARDKSRAVFLRNKYLEDQKKVLQEMDRSLLLKMEVRELLDSNIVTSFTYPSETDPEYENKNYYFGYKFLTGKNDLIFDKQENYKSLFFREIDRIEKEILTNYNDFSTASYEKYILMLYKYPFVFRNSYLFDEDKCLDLTPNEYLIHRFEEKYFEKFKIGIFAGFLVNPPEILTNSVVTKMQYEMKTTMGSIFFGAGFSVKLKREYEHFSRIDVEVGIASGAKTEVLKDNFTGNLFYYTPDPNLGAKVTPHRFTGISDKKDFSAGISISTPVLYLSPIFYFSAGIRGVYAKTEYKFNTQPVDPAQSPDISYYGEDVSESKTIILPTVAANFYLFKFLNLKLEYFPVDKFYAVITANYQF